LDPELQLRVRLAVLFGCPISAVGDLVPASELPYWRIHYEQEPWGFKAQDMLFSKHAKQLSELSGRLRHGVTYRDFMFVDAFESLDLTDADFERLSQEEKDIYVRRKIAAAKMVLD